MRPPIKYALRQEGISEAVYYTDILTHPLNFVKQKIKQALRSFRKDEAITTEIRFYQEICDPDGIKARVALKGSTLFITDKDGCTGKFPAYLVPELRGSLLEVEGKFGQRFHHG